MGVKAMWLDDEKTIISYLFEGAWTWDEMRAAIQQSNALMDTVNYKVDFIADLRKSGLLPSNVLANVRDTAVQQPPHVNYSGLTVFVGTDTLVQTLMNIALKLYQWLRNEYIYTFVATMDEAYELIARSRQEREHA